MTMHPELEALVEAVARVLHWADLTSIGQARAALSVITPLLEAKDAEIARLKAERLKLDKRINRQRMALRDNWEIMEARGYGNHVMRRVRLPINFLTTAIARQRDIRQAQDAYEAAEARATRAEAALATARADALEEAAKLADKYAGPEGHPHQLSRDTALVIAEDIRALKEAANG